MKIGSVWISHRLRERANSAVQNIFSSETSGLLGSEDRPNALLEGSQAKLSKERKKQAGQLAFAAYRDRCSRCAPPVSERTICSKPSFG
jgi:hypothetical protein